MGTTVPGYVGSAGRTDAAARVATRGLAAAGWKVAVAASGTLAATAVLVAATVATRATVVGWALAAAVAVVTFAIAVAVPGVTVLHPIKESATIATMP